MRRIELLVGVLLYALPAAAQVVAPPEIRDEGLRALQQKHLPELKAVAVAIKQHAFPYSFYFSRVLDLEEKAQESRDQRSIQFARNANQVVIEILGNYYAAYSAELMPKEERARRTFQDVILPMLQVEVPQFAAEPEVQGYAFEISHHVRKKALGVPAENPENVVLFIDKADAARVVATTEADQQKEALLHATLFVNGKPASFWPGDVMGEGDPPPQPPAHARGSEPKTPDSAPVAVSVPQAVERDSSPDAIKAIQTARQTTLDKLVHDLDSTAHFVAYAPPAFIGFHNGVYLQLSVTTALQQPDDGSRYKAAALAFDEHVAPLIRPTLAYFKRETGFDGIDFSTTARPAGKTDGGVAVEYIFNFRSLDCYETFDCTGQQLIDSGFVLVNGERISLDLQGAEAGVRR